MENKGREESVREGKGPQAYTYNRDSNLACYIRVEPSKQFNPLLLLLLLLVFLLLCFRKRCRKFIAQELFMLLQTAIT